MHDALVPAGGPWGAAASRLSACIVLPVIASPHPAPLRREQAIRYSRHMGSVADDIRDEDRRALIEAYQTVWAMAAGA